MGRQLNNFISPGEEEKNYSDFAGNAVDSQDSKSEVSLSSHKHSRK